jgi:hypothetical protein
LFFEQFPDSLTFKLILLTDPLPWSSSLCDLCYS